MQTLQYTVQIVCTILYCKHQLHLELYHYCKLWKALLTVSDHLIYNPAVTSQAHDKYKSCNIKVHFKTTQILHYRSNSAFIAQL